jgi:hypothetical protein
MLSLLATGKAINTTALDIGWESQGMASVKR